MALGPEAKVKARIKGFLLTLRNCWFFFPAAHGYGVNGVPDIIGVYRGTFFAIEVKAPGCMSKVTALQKQAIAGINAAQGWAIATDNVEAVRELIKLIEIANGVPKETA